MAISRLFGVHTVSAAAGLIAQPERRFADADTGLWRETFKKYGVFSKIYYPDM